MNEVYAQHVGEDRPARSTVEISALPSGALVEIEAIAYRLSLGADSRSRTTSRRSGSTRTSSAARCATSCSGSTSKDADFLVLGVDHERAARAARAARPRRGSRGRGPARRPAPPGRATAQIRTLAPAGIEFAPPRRERSTGPGRHDFEIVVDASALGRGRPRAPRLHRQRDRAPSRRRGARRPVRRPGGSARTACCARSRRARSRRIRCASSAGCASSRSSTSRPTTTTLRADAGGGRGVRLVSGERIGGGLQADGMGELSKLLLGSRAGEGAAARARHRRPRRDDPRVRARDRLRHAERAAGRDARRAHLRGRRMRADGRSPFGSPRCCTTSASRTRDVEAHAQAARASPTPSSSVFAIRRGCAATSSTLVAAHAFHSTTSTSSSRAASCASTATSSRATWSSTRTPTCARRTFPTASWRRSRACARCSQQERAAAPPRGSRRRRLRSARARIPRRARARPRPLRAARRRRGGTELATGASVLLERAKEQLA